MKYLLELIFEDSTDMIIYTPKEERIGYNAINNALDSDFIDGVIECEGEELKIHNTVMCFYAGIKVEFTRDTFDKYVDGVFSVDADMLKIHLFFSCDKKMQEITRALESITRGMSIHELCKLLNEFPSLYETIKNINSKTDSIVCWNKGFYSKDEFEFAEKIAYIKKENPKYDNISVINPNKILAYLVKKTLNDADWYKVKFKILSINQNCASMHNTSTIDVDSEELGDRPLVQGIIIEKKKFIHSITPSAQNSAKITIMFEKKYKTKSAFGEIFIEFDKTCEKIYEVPDTDVSFDYIVKNSFLNIECNKDSQKLVEKKTKNNIIECRRGFCYVLVRTKN